MAVGDLVVGEGSQYEFNGVLFGTLSDPQIVVDKCEGLDSMPDLRTDDIERNDTHGDYSGVDLLASRVIDMDVNIATSTHVASLNALRLLGAAMRPRRDTVLQQLVFQRPGEPKRFVYAKPRRKEFPSNYDLAQGLGKGALQWYAPDPRIYRFTETVTDITIPAGATSATGTVTNGGDFETWPVVEILGQGTNPRVTHNGQARANRFDLTMANANDLLTLDSARRTAVFNGGDGYQYRRGDNQWFDLLPGANSITVTRTGTTGTLRFRFRHRDAWI
jgi:phage-related protein